MTVLRWMLVLAERPM